ncbi:putative thiazole-containing bacteriocin maturation protein [Ectobacillus sp. JY-23]|uniref:putative thiazole-containing bacteriocin maturation protein n=1 Tax=Ectobacillus sp. JY-23 TaxID=2933872 RepID=UPI001FF60E88|nr:putative thiazole-containing bacteriocin maturation protein [Ectobacillus sp. JY-23]UOY91774.1 putative thiazole-containing bacteriocin maturation protein [Ectobacillus sp. JY-23]
MTLHPSMRLKVNRDTCFLPDPDGGVYFRNNESSFRMQGNGMVQWIEKLLPVWDGSYSLAEITNGLPEPYQNRVYEIAKVLYENGYARDVSGDREHSLSATIMEVYASQIAFLDERGGSGAARFAEYRNASVIVIGDQGLPALVSSLLESGLPRFHVCALTECDERIDELAAHSRKRDEEILVEQTAAPEDGNWQAMLQPFDFVVYVSYGGDTEKLLQLEQICREEGKVFLPAGCFAGIGMAGPIVSSDVCWESAWRVIRAERGKKLSSVAGAMLTNILTFELLKEVTGVRDDNEKHRFFQLNLETLEGEWCSFTPHPLLEGYKPRWIQGLEKREELQMSELLFYFSKLTSAKSGILHVWEEGNLKQLPLAKCRVQAVHPLSEGPASFLEEVICTALTHEEARKEAGLVGLEMYVAAMIEHVAKALPQYREDWPFIAVGTGATTAEGICRGLLHRLEYELAEQNKSYGVAPIQINRLEDTECKFYLEVLELKREQPVIGLGEEIWGFPVVWVKTESGWYHSTGLDFTLALRNALRHAIEGSCVSHEPFLLPQEPQTLDLEGSPSYPELLQYALTTLQRQEKELSVFEVGIETFSKELAGVFGVLVREEGA